MIFCIAIALKNKVSTNMKKLYNVIALCLCITLVITSLPSDALALRGIAHKNSVVEQANLQENTFADKQNNETTANPIKHENLIEPTAEEPHRNKQAKQQEQTHIADKKPSQHPVYDPLLKKIVVITIALSLVSAFSVFTVSGLYSYSLCIKVALSITTFISTLYPAKFLFSNIIALLYRKTRDVILNRPLITPVYRNRKNTHSSELSESLTIMVPIYDEPFFVIRKTLDNAILELKDYGTKANLVVCDDGLMAFANNDLEGFEERALSTPALKRTENQKEALERLEYYRSLVADKDIRFAIVARPKTVENIPETERKGTFRKGSNLNFTHKLFDLVKTKHLPYEEAQKSALKDILGNSSNLAYIANEVSIGDFILLLDKDSITPTGISREAIEDFLADEKLSYIQCATEPYNTDDNYFTRLLSHFTRINYSISSPIEVNSGSMVALVGHNAFIRTTHLKERGYWSENRVSEDRSLALDLAADGYHGKYLDLEDMRFKELVSNSYEDEMSRRARYSYGLGEIYFNPITDWFKKGLITEQFKNFLKSNKVPWQLKIDAIIYFGSYFNVAIILPFSLLVSIGLLPSISCAGFITYLLVFMGSAFPIVILYYANRGQNKNSEESMKSILKKQFTTGLIVAPFITSSSYYVLKGYLLHFLGKKPYHAPTAVGIMKNMPLNKIWREMFPATRKLGFLLLVFIIATTIGYLINGFTVGQLYVPLFGFSSVILMPFIMNPKLIEALWKKIKESLALNNLRGKPYSLREVFFQQTIEPSTMNTQTVPISNNYQPSIRNSVPPIIPKQVFRPSMDPFVSILSRNSKRQINPVGEDQDLRVLPFLQKAESVVKHFSPFKFKSIKSAA